MKPSAHHRYLLLRVPYHHIRIRSLSAKTVRPLLQSLSAPRRRSNRRQDSHWRWWCCKDWNGWPFRSQHLLQRYELAHRSHLRTVAYKHIVQCLLVQTIFRRSLHHHTIYFTILVVVGDIRATAITAHRIEHCTRRNSHAYIWRHPLPPISAGLMAYDV